MLAFGAWETRSGFSHNLHFSVLARVERVEAERRVDVEVAEEDLLPRRSAEQASTAPLSACARNVSARVCSQGSRSSSVKGRPERIFSTFALLWKLSPSIDTGRIFCRLKIASSAFFTVDVPAPESWTQFTVKQGDRQETKGLFIRDRCPNFLVVATSIFPKAFLCRVLIFQFKSRRVIAHALSRVNGQTVTQAHGYSRIGMMFLLTHDCVLCAQKGGQ